MTNTITANGTYVAIEFEVGDTTVKKGEIILPHHAIENSKLNNGTVISVGPDCVLGIKEGDEVLYDLWSINKYNDSVGLLKEENVILIER